MRANIICTYVCDIGTYTYILISYFECSMIDHLYHVCILTNLSYSNELIF
jgi:hypothetical protein